MHTLLEYSVCILRRTTLRAVLASTLALASSIILLRPVCILFSDNNFLFHMCIRTTINILRARNTVVCILCIPLIL